MKFDNIFFINGTAYAGKSTMVKRLAEKYNGIAFRRTPQFFLNSGFRVIVRDENRSIEDTLALAEKEFGLQRNRG